MENKSAEHSWLDRDIKRFKDIGWVIPKNQYKLYHRIMEKWVSGRTVVDIGSSIGVGTNILSHQARAVWGIDINEEAIRYAQQVFARPNLDFAVLDIENPPNRPLSTFEVVVCMEVIEHLPNYVAGLNTIKSFFDGDKTIGFITAPNIGNARVKEDDANNSLHLNHWTAGEFYGLLIKHFRSVTLFGSERIRTWEHSETTDGDSQDRIVVAKVQGPIQGPIQ